MPSLGDLVDGLEVGIAELDVLEIAVDPRRGGALGQDDVTPLQSPRDQDLRQRVVPFLRDVDEGLVGVDLLPRRRDLVLRPQRRVGGGHDVVLEAELDEVVVGQERVDFDLVDLGLDLGEFEELLEPRDGPVRDADGAGLALFVQLFHRAPCRLWVLGQLFLDDVLFLLVSRFLFLLLFIYVVIYLAVGADLGAGIGVLLGGDGPMDEEEVDVVELEPLEGVVERPLDLILLVQVVPDLGADEEIGALDACVFLQEVPDGLADLVLVEVEPGAVEVPVAGPQGMDHGGIGLAFGALVGEGAEAYRGDGNPVVQFESYS